MKNALILILSIAFSSHLFADSTSTTQSISDYFHSNSNAYNPDGVWLFLGSNVGLIDLIDNSNLPNRDGHQVNFKAVGSLYSLEQQLITDLGLGFQSNSTSGYGSEFTNQSFFIDANARWEFTERWSVGPVVNLLLGNKNSFTNEKKSFASFVGATVHYRHPVNQFWLLKVGARVLTDIDISSRQVNKWLLDFQIGFPPTNNGSVALKNNDLKAHGDEAEYATFEDIEIEEVETELESFNPNQGPLVSIKMDDLKYEKGKIQPSFNDQQYIKRLAEALSAHQDLFHKVNIKGHAGDFKLDKKLGNTNKIISHSRAKDVLKKLATNGLPSSKIFSMSYGEFNPNQVDLNKQKVELEFSGVKNEAKLKEIIQSIKQ